MGGKRRKDDNKRDDVAIKIDREVCEWARVVAAARGISLAEYITEVLRPVVRKDRWALGDELLSDRPGNPGDGPAGGPPGLPGPSAGSPPVPPPPSGSSLPPGPPMPPGPRWLNPDPGPSEPPADLGLPGPPGENPPENPPEKPPKGKKDRPDHRRRKPR